MTKPWVSWLKIQTFFKAIEWANFLGRVIERGPIEHPSQTYQCHKV